MFSQYNIYGSEKKPVPSKETEEKLHKNTPQMWPKKYGNNQPERVARCTQPTGREKKKNGVKNRLRTKRYLFVSVFNSNIHVNMY